MAVPSPRSPFPPSSLTQYSFPSGLFTRQPIITLYLKSVDRLLFVTVLLQHPASFKQQKGNTFFRTSCLLGKCMPLHKLFPELLTMNCPICWRGNVLADTPSLSHKQIDLHKHTTGSHEGKRWCRNSLIGNRTFQQCFHTFSCCYYCCGDNK